MNNLNENDVVYFSTTTCPPCKMTKPIVEKVSTEKEINIQYYTIDSEENGREVASEYNVNSVPTIIFFKDGEEVSRKTGLINEQTYRNLLSEHLNVN